MKAFLFSIIFCCTLTLSAQPSLPKKVSAKLPSLLGRNHLPTSTQLQKGLSNGSSWGQDRKSVQKLWVVYSDRENNVTYETPEGTFPFGVLHFGEKVCIAEIKGDMAHVYSDEKAHYPEIPNGIKSKGWIPLENLLLWSKCPQNKSGVKQRVITAVNLDKMPRNGKVQLKKYNSPDDLESYNMIEKNLGLYFVMKETDHGEYALLSTSATVNSAQSLFGWVNKNNFVDFSQRVFLEPEWMPEYVCAHRGEKAIVYGDENMISVIMHLEYRATSDDLTPSSPNRMPKNQLRFPVLSKPDANGMIRCLCFGKANQYDEFFLKERAGINYNEVMEQIRNEVCSYEGFVKSGSGWKYVLLLSSDEMKDILDKTRFVVTSISPSHDRTIFSNALLSVVRESTNDGIMHSDDDFLKMPIWAILYKIYGIDMVEEGYDDLYRYSLKDINDRKRVPDNDFYRILNRFENKYRELSSNFSNYDYRIDIQGMYYYWIPLDDMP